MKIKVKLINVYKNKSNAGMKIYIANFIYQIRSKVDYLKLPPQGTKENKIKQKKNDTIKIRAEINKID